MAEADVGVRCSDRTDAMHATRYPDDRTAESAIVGRLPVRIAVSGDGPGILTEPGHDRSLDADETAVEELPGLGRVDLIIVMPPQTGTCDLRRQFGGDPVRTLHLGREEAADPDLAAMDSRFDVCITSRPGRMDTPGSAFFAGRWLSQTAAMEPGTIRLLPRRARRVQCQGCGTA